MTIQALNPLNICLQFSTLSCFGQQWQEELPQIIIFLSGYSISSLQFSGNSGYNDYTLFSQWPDNGIYFVTRLKDNVVYRIVESRSVLQNRTILADQIIQITGHKAEDICPHLLRRVVVWDEAHNRIMSLLTNHLTFGATTISDI